MRGMMRVLGWIAVITVLAGVGWWQWLARLPEVSLVEVRRGSVAEIVYATGVVEPTVWAKVVPPVRARIVFHCHCEGKTVKEGDVLLRLDETGPRAELAQAEARREFLAQEIRRQTDLLGRGTVTRQTFERTQSELGQIEAQIAAINARLADYILRAPVSGMVLRADGEVGEIAGTAEPLFWVGQPKPLQILAEVNEEDIARVVEGQRVLLRSDAFATSNLEATIGSITPKGDPVKKTFRVYMALPETSPLRIGMSVEANIVAREVKDAVVAPSEAVVNDNVFIVDGDKVRRRQVSIGLRGTRALQITGGIEPGTRIVSPARDLREGARIRIKAGAP
jgi:RND family efflux transporter MFP subunit